MHREYVLNKKLLDYVMSSYVGLIEDGFEDYPKEFPYLECTSAFFDMLYKEYEIDFNPELIGEELSIKIDDEILNYIKK